MGKIVLEELNKMLLKEHIEGNPNLKVKMNKEELIMFAIKLIKLVNCIDN